jgi:hypothetical protein
MSGGSFIAAVPPLRGSDAGLFALWFKNQNRISDPITGPDAEFIAGENQETGADRGGLNYDTRGHGLLPARVRPQRITRLVRHSSMPPQFQWLMFSICRDLTMA